MELTLSPTWLLSRMTQWGVLAILMISALTSDLDAAAALGMVLIGWSAKMAADREEDLTVAHHNMRHYIRRGGLHNPPRRVPLARMS